MFWEPINKCHLEQKKCKETIVILNLSLSRRRIIEEFSKRQNNRRNVTQADKMILRLPMIMLLWERRAFKSRKEVGNHSKIAQLSSTITFKMSMSKKIRMLLDPMNKVITLAQLLTKKLEGTKKKGPQNLLDPQSSTSIIQWLKMSKINSKISN
jgi:hypothetical protein